MSQPALAISEKIMQLSEEQLAEVVRASMALSETSF
jgi:hypothetical protein